MSEAIIGSLPSRYSSSFVISGTFASAILDGFEVLFSFRASSFSSSAIAFSITSSVISFEVIAVKNSLIVILDSAIKPFFLSSLGSEQPFILFDINLKACQEVFQKFLKKFFMTYPDFLPVRWMFVCVCFNVPNKVSYDSCHVLLTIISISQYRENASGFLI